MKQYKTNIILFISILFCVLNAHAQREIELKDLNIPNSPAFTILDYSPAIIDKPGTAKAFSANIVSLLSESQGIPKNFAIEVAPFWFFKNNLTVFRYHGINPTTRTQNNIFANARNFSLSVGSVYKDSTKEHPYNANYLSLGARISLIKIVRSPVINETVNSITAIAGRMTQLTPGVTRGCLGSHTVNTPIYSDCIERELTTAFNGDQEMVLQEKRLSKLLEIKPLFQLDIAAAGSWAYKDNTLENNHTYRTGIWTTMEFSLPLSSTTNIEEMLENKNYINLYGTLRYIKQDSTIDFKTFGQQKFLDIGGRFELEFDKLSLSFETVHRFDQANVELNTSRNVGILQYRINDQLFLSGTFGKNFGSVKNLVALFGINWGFGKQSLAE
ncbi:MAG TPA: hypothetical protein PL108_09620 [Sediminibacterium sp.]|nr:hypothetical protein [Sediminibacterium sp.]